MSSSARQIWTKDADPHCLLCAPAFRMRAHIGRTAVDFLIYIRYKYQDGLSLCGGKLAEIRALREIDLWSPANDMS